MLSQFILKKLQSAQYKLLKDGAYFGEIAGLAGVWASAPTLEACRNELQEILEEWLVLKLMAREPVSGFSVKCLETNKRSVAHHA